MHAGSINPQTGFGDWKSFDMPLETIFAASVDWKKQTQGVEKPWLCWNVNSRWSLLQQRLVRHVGWTPVVGFDPRVGPPQLIPGSIVIDFNAKFGLPLILPYLPLEFMFLWADKLAFWHSDLLCRLGVMEQLAEKFSALEDGEMAAVLDRGGRRNWFNYKRHRFFELIGCTTRAASESQFYNGCGWFRNIGFHPKCTLAKERRRRWSYHFDHGGGIMYWKRKYNGSVHPIPMRLVQEGHCTNWNPRCVARPRFATTEVKPADDLTRACHIGDRVNLDEQYPLDEVAQKLGIAHLASTST
jgi:hypothetical protein